MLSINGVIGNVGVYGKWADFHAINDYYDNGFKTFLVSLTHISDQAKVKSGLDNDLGFVQSEAIITI